MLDNPPEGLSRGILTTPHGGVTTKEMSPVINPAGNFKRILASYDYRRYTPPITPSEKMRSIGEITQYLDKNLLFFHAAKGGIAAVEGILKNGYKPASETGVETGSITEMDKLLGTDHAVYFAIGTPNMYITEHGFDGPLLVYDSTLPKQNRGGYLNMSRRYIGENRLRFDPYLQDPSQFTPAEAAQLDKEINQFSHDFLGMMLPPDLKYIAQYMKHESIPTILDLLSDARKWELIFPQPQIGKPKAIIFRSQDQMKAAQAKFPDLLENIVLSVQETITTKDPIELHVAPGSGSLINTYEVYKSLGLDVGVLRVNPGKYKGTDPNHIVEASEDMRTFA